MEALSLFLRDTSSEATKKDVIHNSGSISGINIHLSNKGTFN